jgi:hypothetical protein
MVLATHTPFGNNPVIKSVPALRDRTLRRPKHTWSASSLPYRLTPIALVPVMAGDTLKTASYQVRALSSPLVNPLRGWFLEYWFFYVRVMDMNNGAAILAKMIDESAGAYTPETADPNVYHGYGINWMQRCIELITPIYFRDYGEAWNVVVDTGLPVLQMRSHGWFENYIADSALPADDTNATDYENLWSKWQVLSRNRLTTQTYEEFLRSQGVKPPANLREPDADLKIPELIRYYRDWQFPVSTINPSTGLASNAVSWAVADKIERPRRFTEPGFIVGFSCVRPKEYTPVAAGAGTTSVYQTGAASGALNTSNAWIPPVYAREPGMSLRKFTAGTGPVNQKAATFDYWIDHRDLFLQGDQMVIGTPSGLVNPRRDAPLWKYPTDAGLYTQFSSGDAPGSVITQEGLASFTIAGRVRRTTAAPAD